MVHTFYFANSECYKRLYELLPKLRVWHVMLTLGFVKVTRGYVKKEIKVSMAIYFS